MNEGMFSIHQTADRGEGLFCDKPFKNGDTILSVMPFNPQPFNFVNHACEPSCAMHYNHVIAGHDLSEGEEITIDYSAISFLCRPDSFVCKCGSPKCRGTIRL